MKKMFWTIALSALCGAAVAQSANSPAMPAASPPLTSLPVGSMLPDGSLTFQTTEGANTTLDQNRNKFGLLVMFSCNTCPYVVRAQARTKEVMTLAKKKGVGMVIVNSNEGQREGEDSYEAMKTYAKEQGYTVPYIRDDHSLLANDFGSTRTPEVFLFDQNGRLVYKGAMEDNPSDPAHSKRKFLEEAINNLIAGKPINPTETKSIGCAIKRKG